MRSRCISALRFLALAGWMILETGRPALAGSQPQTLCPVLGGEIDRSVYADYEDKRIYFCCAGCIDTFQRSPAKYVRDLEATGIVFEKISAAHGSSSDQAGRGETRSLDAEHAPQGLDGQGLADQQGQETYQGQKALGMDAHQTQDDQGQDAYQMQDAHNGQEAHQGQDAQGMDAYQTQDAPVRQGDYQGQHDHQGNRADEGEGTHRGMHGTGCPMM